MSNMQPIRRPLAALAQVMEDPFEEVRTRATVEAPGKEATTPSLHLPFRLYITD